MCGVAEYALVLATDRHQFTICNIDSITAVHLDAYRSQPDPFAHFLSIYGEGSLRDCKGNLFLKIDSLFHTPRPAQPTKKVPDTFSARHGLDPNGVDLSSPPSLSRWKPD